MSKRSSWLYLKDIIEAIERIQKYTRGLSFEDFADDMLIADAVVRNFEIIGEAAKNIPLTIKSKHWDIPWKEMAGMRDKMIHEYFGVDLEIVWKTIKHSLPGLRKSLKRILK